MEPFDEIRKHYQEKFHQVLDCFSPTIDELDKELASVETYQNAVERVLPILANLSKEHEGQDVLVVSHGGIIKGLLMHLAGHDFEKPIVKNTGYIKLKRSGGTFVVNGVHGIS